MSRNLLARLSRIAKESSARTKASGTTPTKKSGYLPIFATTMNQTNLRIPMIHLVVPSRMDRKDVESII